MLEIAKILELLETTSDSKLNTAKREYAPVKVSATESANDMLNKELGMDKEAPAKEPSKVPSKFLNKKRVVEEIDNNDFEIKDGVLVKYNGTSKDVVIPDGVTKIGDEAFMDNNLTSVTIPNSVTKIGYYAFWNNNLTSVKIPNSVTKIDFGAFASNKLTSVTIPNSVKEISGGAFMNNNLTSVTIPNSVTKIGDNAFYKNQLTSVTIPDSVTKIGPEAFYGNKLTRVNVPNNLASADRDAFDDNVKIIWDRVNKRADEDIELGTPAEGAFPESLIFDEEAFSDEYGVEVETISAAYVAESEDGQIPEHLEISFEFEGSNIVLSVMADGAVEETVDGEFIEPAQFSGEIGERENEDGEVDQVLTLTLLDEESEDEESVKSEEDELTKSEGDEDHTDEDGTQITEEELIEQRGLEEDEYYATSHDMNVSKNPANRMDSRLGTSRPERSVGESRKGTGKKITSARESLAAKTNRKYKR